MPAREIPSYIKMETLPAHMTGNCRILLLPGEIPGAAVSCLHLPSGETISLEGQNEHICILFLCSGSVTFEAEHKTFSYHERALFTAKPQSDILISAHSDAILLEICWDMSENDLKDLEKSTTEFPISLAYADAEQYRDFFKSETTISRALLKQSVIPRFAMGSVEANGDDLVGQHAHPLLDQFFFSFPENDMNLLIDCHICPMKGDTLLHIPLGSNHGVIAQGDQKMHYLWIDCTPEEQKDAAVAYLNEVHKPTGVKQTLED